MLSTQYGFNTLLKEGSKHYSGLEESILKNIDACKQISNMTKTSLGPNGAKKMIINYLDKIFVTSDAATILKELEVQHPAAKMIVMATKMQEQEYGDGTNFVITLSGELLNQAEGLIKMGLHPNQIVTGYELALKKTITDLEESSQHEIKDVKNLEEVVTCLTGTLSSKLVGTGEFFARLIAQACIQILPENPKNFDIEYVRVSKILGKSITDSYVMKGILVARNAETISVQRVEGPKIPVVVYSCPLDTQSQETKGTVLIKSAQELLNYSKSEEELAHVFIKKIADSGAKVVVVGGNVSDICLHYLEKYKLMAVKVSSKFELKRLCKALSATALVRLDGPMPDELGTADLVEVREIGSQKVCVFERNSGDCKLATIVVRGSTNSLLDDIERAIDDGVNAFKNLCKDGKFVAGGGALEIELARKLDDYANTFTSLDQYAVRQFGKAFEIIPRILSENAGLNGDNMLGKLYSTHSAGNITGIDVEKGEVKSAKELNIWDHLQTKLWGVKMAADAAITVLRIDQIIIAKPAGGPKPKEKTNWDED
jgi:T-complex protein 1 subunit theta